MSDDIGGGWLPVHDPFRIQKKRPEDYPEVEMMRAGWPQPKKTPWKEIHPLMNVSGLYWRPAK